ncbi:MAG: response regulator [Elusimicrobiota bacterium]|nr:response regulator [Elusimicrobiota bacterium]
MAAQIIVVDDDPIVGSLTLELLQDAGFTALWVSDSLKAEGVIKENKPALVILDILMPGIDGLTLLHRLKSDPETAAIKAIVVSGKSFEPDKVRALQYGAELFIEKPYDVEVFAKKVTEILAGQGMSPEKQPRPVLPPVEARAELKAAIWGFRSKAGAGSPASSKFGKNTPCVSVETPAHLFVFDAGTGIAALGNEVARAKKRREAWLFLTGFAADRVEGLPVFSGLRDPDFTLHISGASDPDKPLEDALRAVLEPAFGAETPKATLELYELMEQTYEILPGVRLTAFYANHPGTTLGFILQTEGRKIAYCPASEIYGEYGTALQDYDEKLGGLVRGCDVLFHDGRYTEEDYRANRNKGHSSFLAAVDFAGKNKIKQLVLMHQDDAYGDDVLDKMARDADDRVKAKGYPLKVLLAREGLRLTL